MNQHAEQTCTHRIITLDLIRGVAVMGIFSVNVIAFAMIEAAYLNPETMGGTTGADLVTWAANSVFIDGKMRSLFSMLFGASALLVMDRAEARGGSSAGTHFARMAVLAIFGLLHFYLIWWGDILFSYAAVGCLLFLFRHCSVAALLRWSAGLFIVSAALLFSITAQLSQAEHAARSPRATTEQVEAWQEQAGFIDPSPREAAREVTVYQGDFPRRFEEATSRRAWDPFILLIPTSPETLALMLLGMALFRSGFLTGDWSTDAYRRTAAWTLAFGLPAAALLTYLTWRSGFEVAVILRNYLVLSTPLRPLIATGYAAVIILLLHRPTWLRDRIAAAGRCAFTNYLGTSILAALLFYGDGFGLFARLSRADAWLVVPLFWLLMLAWSKPWLERFNYGPFEWLWRSMSRLKLQPMRRPRARRTTAPVA